MVMAADELHYDLMELLGQFRRQLADSGTGNLSPEGEAQIGAIGVKAHQEATALLATLESDEFKELL